MFFNVFDFVPFFFIFHALSAVSGAPGLKLPSPGTCRRLLARTA
jgi:hypothetical protein